MNDTPFAGLRFVKTYTPNSLTLRADATGGDANLDGHVNLADFNILASFFGQSGVNWLRADFTGDGMVNLNDFNVLAGHFGQGAGGPEGGAGVSPADWAALASSVPEPGAAGAAGALALVAVAVVSGRRRELAYSSDRNAASR